MYRLATIFGLASALPPPQGLSAAPVNHHFLNVKLLIVKAIICRMKKKD